MFNRKTAVKAMGKTFRDYLSENTIMKIHYGEIIMSKIESLIPGTIDFLIKKAKLKEKTTYKEIGNAVGTHSRVVPKILWKIENIRLERGWPPLTAIVIRIDSRKPGSEFLKYLFPDIADNELENKWKIVIQKVYDFDWNRAYKNYLDEGKNDD
jgi:hypothetical protein